MSCQRAFLGLLLRPPSLILRSGKFANSPSQILFKPKPTFSVLLTRSYAKGKSKGADGKNKKKQAASAINENDFAELVAVDAMKTQMQRALDILKDEYVKNLSLRSTTGSIESIKVKFEGQDHALNELAQVVRKNPKTLVVNCSSVPQSIPNILQAIKQSGMNLNPQQDGTTLFIPIPVVTKEHRENLAKNAKSLFIKGRDNIKEVQNKYVRNLKKAAGVSEDLIFGAQQQITAIADKYVGEAEKMLQTKQEELVGKQ
ncbi:ribosome-recycling factor, mitochondrial [Neocloeon triangulifer]|uniref:ribosome-recycling factor, mitochondrial n=1 Tax=Neocloeon triangulifer TaxID=2078957 RepID=UPI00286ED23D|nr:ribosome-recycling factor, mitochondrial [Neocloeon triangulifer]